MSDIETNLFSAQLFGPLEIQIDGEPLQGLHSEAGYELLALLILVHKRVTERKWLAQELWADRDVKDLLASLRQELFSLRNALGKQRHRLTTPTPKSLRFDVNWANVDVISFANAIESGDTDSLKKAVALYRGPLLEGCNESWVYAWREQYQSEYLNALRTLATKAIAVGDHDNAASWLKQIIATDPSREEAHRTLMDVLAKSGNLSASLQVYHDFRRQLLQHDGKDQPSPETRGLYEKIRTLAQQKVTISREPVSSFQRIYVIPSPLTNLVGRTKEIADVVAVFRTHRLVTLTGSGGVGKTRLAIAVMHAMADSFDDGLVFVTLEAAAFDGNLIANEIASAIGLRLEPGRDASRAVIDYLKSRSFLLTVDNCEHLLDSCAELITELLNHCPQLRILATSREALGLHEATWRVPSLLTPDLKQLGNKHSLLEAVSSFDAVQLFVERACSAHNTFALNDENAPHVAQICCRLDGIPLAIELAAARVRSLTVQEINDRLDNRFRLLTSGSKTAMPRQQTLLAMIQWSYDFLSSQEKALLCRLSVFAGGWTMEAAEAVGVGGDISDWEVLDLLTLLVDKSLIVVDIEQKQSRYRLMETIRQYAQDRLVESGVRDIVRERHQRFFVEFVEEAEPGLIGPEQAAWLNRIEREHDNLRAALDWGSKEVALRIVGAMWRFWAVRGHFSEGLERMADVLAATDALAHTSARAKALRGAGVLLRYQGNLESAQKVYRECLALYRDLDDKHGVAFSLSNMGTVAHHLGDYLQAYAFFEETLTIMRELGDNRGIGGSLLSLGDLARDEGDYTDAWSKYDRGLAMLTAAGDKQGIAYSVYGLGRVAYEQGDYLRSELLHEEALTVLRELDDKSAIAELLASFGSLACVQNQPLRAAHFWGAADALREQVGTSFPPAEQTNYDRQIANVHAALGENVFSAAWAEGRAMTMEKAIELALMKSADLVL